SDGRRDPGPAGAEALHPRQRRERLEPEDALEERRRPVAHRPELALTSCLRHEPALHQARDDAVDVDAADTGDLRPRARAEVRDDGERLERRLREPALGGPLL